MTPDTYQAEAVAGWYVDPLGRAELRYWDGARWTPQVRSSPSTRHRRSGVVWVVVLVVALLSADLLARHADANRSVRLVPSQSAGADLEPAVLDPEPPSTTTTSTTTTTIAPTRPLPPAADAVAAPAPGLAAAHATLSYAGDFPDPSIVLVGSTYWAYATGSGGRNLSLMSSPDLATWTDPVDALPVLPSWAAPGFTWAPAILPVDSGYLLYYTARVAASGRQCISVAYAKTPDGPFLDISHAPMICQLQSGGSIDPSPFVAPDGTRYLLWKSEENALGSASRIGVQKLTPDGTGVVGRGVALLDANAPWQDGVVEGPAMGYIGGRYVLFYGANHWDTRNAGIGYALCDGPMGPCVNQSVSGPWIGSSPGVLGPSGPSVFTDKNGTNRLAFHAWRTTSQRMLVVRAAFGV